MPLHPDGQAPYAPAPAVMRVVEGYRERGLATPFNASVLARAGVSDSLVARTLQALVQLGLIDDDGNPTEAFEGLRKASSEEYTSRLAAVVRSAYEEVFQFVEPRDDPPEKVRDAFRPYRPNGQQQRMVNLFLGLCEAAGIIDEQPKRGRQASTTQAKARKVPKRPAKATPTSPPPDEPQPEFTPSPSPQSGQHPFIRGLIQSLPPAGEPWSMEGRERWTAAALAAFDLIYERPTTPDKDGAS